MYPISIKQRLRTCTPVQGSNSPEVAYRTASFIVYLTKVLLSIESGHFRGNRMAKNEIICDSLVSESRLKHDEKFYVGKGKKE